MITVVTSITGAYDGLIEDQNRGRAKFVAFTDEPQWSDTWEIRKACDLFKDPRRNSRIHKILTHQYIDTEYSIWIDGNLRLLVPPEELVEKHLRNHDIALFRHPTRDCVYDEMDAVLTLGFENGDILQEQATEYSKQGFPEHRGLTENNVIIRRHTPKVEELNNAWWSEYCRFSKRDQTSFIPAVDRAGTRVNIINETWAPYNGTFRRGGIEYANHLKPRV